MSELTSNNWHQTFYNQFSELFKLYEEVKKIVLLAEYENQGQKYLISSVNELRNSLDHIMRIVEKPETLQKNFDKARGHLYRAGYDAYEILVVAKMQEIKRVKEDFSLEAITTAFPDYHNLVIPTIQKAKNELVFARGNKRIDDTNEGNPELDVNIEKAHFSNFESIATSLIKLTDDINLRIAGIKEVQDLIISKERLQAEKEYERIKDEKRKNRRVILLLGIIIPLIIGIVILFVEYNFFVSKASNLIEDKPLIENRN